MWIKRGSGLIVAIPLFLVCFISQADEVSFSDEVKEYRKRGYQAYKEGNLDKAYQFFKKAVLLAPENPILHNDLGIIYERRGLKELAIKEYLEAIRIEPRYPAPYMNLALLYNELGARDKVIFYLKERIRLGKKKDFWYKKALAMLKSYEELSPPVHAEEKKEGLPSEEKLVLPKTEHKKTVSREEENMPLKKEFYNLSEVERIYEEGRNALSEGNFSLAIEKINQLLMLNPLYKAPEEILISTEKEKLIQETREEEPIVLNIP